MGSMVNFLTQGQPLTASTSTYSSTQVPQYLSDYLYNVLSGAYSAAAQPYQAYAPPIPDDVSAKGPAAVQDYMKSLPASELQKYERIAGFDPLQQKSFDVVAGTYDPVTGKQITPGAAGAYADQLAAAEKTAAGAGALSTMKAADPYFAKASQTVPGVISDYMNPYNKQVIETMGTEAERQVKEKLLPQLGDVFTRAGQYGSSRHQEIAQRGVRDIASDLESNVGKLLAQGYTTAGQQAGADLTRMASIGQAAGQLTGTEEQQKAALANVQAGLGQKEQALGLTGAAALEATGAQRRNLQQAIDDLRYQDFQKQTQYPEEQLSWLSGIVRGLPSGGETSTKTGTSTGQNYSASPLASLASAGLSASAISSLLGKI